MTEKEIKKLSRADLLQLLLEQSVENEQLRARVEELENKLAERELNIKNSGSLAEAAMRVNGVFEAAQAAAEQYMENLQNTNPTDGANDLPSATQLLKKQMPVAVGGIETESAKDEVCGNSHTADEEAVLERCRKLEKDTAEKCDLVKKMVSDKCKKMEAATAKRCKLAEEKTVEKCRKMEEDTVDQCRYAIEQTKAKCAKMKSDTIECCKALRRRAAGEVIENRNSGKTEAIDANLYTPILPDRAATKKEQEGV